jgi:hypothetical protein
MNLFIVACVFIGFALFVLGHALSAFAAQIKKARDDVHPVDKLFAEKRRQREVDALIEEAEAVIDRRETDPESIDRTAFKDPRRALAGVIVDAIIEALVLRGWRPPAQPRTPRRT